MSIPPDDRCAPAAPDSQTETLFRRLTALSRNLWWTWHPEVGSLFFELDPARFRELGSNPVALMQELDAERLEQRASELMLRSRINYAYRRLEEYLAAEDTWGSLHAGVLKARPVAYFSAEFCLHESLPIYSGGLGVLAGDHMKSASDLGVPMVGVGLFYRQGYFMQRLDRDGQQHEEYYDADVSKLPMDVALDASGKPIVIEIACGAGTVRGRVWKIQVGRNIMLLLDSNVEGNGDEDRDVTSRLYGGDDRVRIKQEMLLGVGGVRALRAAGIRPAVIHLNEGHSAFAALELAREAMEIEGIDLAEALDRARQRIVFTTHTPVPAGHDRFPRDLLAAELAPLQRAIGIPLDTLMDLGREDGSATLGLFCMTALAIRMARRSNGVSALHGRVSRKMWLPIFPGHSVDEVPIGHITNGVHVQSWLAPQMLLLYDRHLGPGWLLRTAASETWAGIQNVPPGELWETHAALKMRLIEFVRGEVAAQYRRRAEPPELLDLARRVLRPGALLIGFARRFAAYKRASLLLTDPDRLARLVNDPGRPIQIVFAGEAHPKDALGKSIVREVARLTLDPRFAGKLVFVEDYDMHVTRPLVQGVDVWLNNPRRPLEASGTSGQKAVLNGVLNLSVLDGWWAEAYDGQNGFAIGVGETHTSADVQDERDAEALFAALERDVIPLYYLRDRDGLPHGWIRRMKQAIRTLGWRFNADRMVMDYVRDGYLPSAGGTSCDMPR